MVGWAVWQEVSSRQPSVEMARPVIDQRPINFASRTFDRANPPADMPPLSVEEEAVCDSNFLSNASVGGQTRQTDATHGTVTITQIKMTLQLNVTIWAPSDAPAHVMEHEDGHREISEYYYQGAGKMAEGIAARYMGRQIDIAGANLEAESNKALQQMAAEITAEYGKELNPGPTQQLYDEITAHSRNGAVTKDAVEHAIKNAAIEAAPAKGHD